MWLEHPIRHRGWLSVAAILLLALYPVESAAQASSDPFALTWQAPADCPDRAELTRRVEVFLGQWLAVRRAQELKIAAVVTEDPTAGFIAKLSVATAEAAYERRSDHRDCARLTEAAALVMALAIDPERVRALEANAASGNHSDAPVAPIAPSTNSPAATDAVPPAAGADPASSDIPQAPPAGAAVPASAATPATAEPKPKPKPEPAAEPAATRPACAPTIANTAISGELRRSGAVLGPGGVCRAGPK